MNIWRMKLRAGSHGPDMWPLCRDRGIAAITYAPITNTDLTELAPIQVNPEVKGPARTSIKRFAWEILVGDVIYVGDSVKSKIIARGFALGTVRERAYRYNPGNAITAPSNPLEPWRHEIPVDWDTEFTPFPYRDPAPRYTVMPFRPPSDKDDEARGVQSCGKDAEAFKSLLNEDAYMRETEAFRKNILRLHVRLSNQFRLWLERTFSANVNQEENRIDLSFNCFEKKNLAELKICCGENTRHAIREAMGQLLEYNHYPPHEEAQLWWLVLDCEPSKTDRKYVLILRQKYGIPLTLAWRNGKDFDAFPSLPIEAL